MDTVKVEANQVEKGKGDIPVCGLCRKCFATVSARNLHIRTLHEGERYACQVCDKLFNRKDRLNQHISHVPRVRNRTTVLNVVKTSHIGVILDNISRVSTRQSESTRTVSSEKNEPPV